MTEAELQVARHEAGHASAALTQGIPIRAIERWSPNPARWLGCVRMSFGHMSRERARKLAIVMLAGPAMQDVELPSWPLAPSKSLDERYLSLFCERLELDEAGYDELVNEMWDLSDTHVFKRLFVALTSWLELQPTLDSRMVREAARIATDGAVA